MAWVLGGIAAGFAGLFQSAQQVVGAVVKTVVAPIVQIATTTVTIVKDIIETGVEVVKSLVETGVEIVKEVVRTVGTIVKTAVDTIVSVGTEIIQKTGAFVGEVGRTLASVSREIANKVTFFFKEVTQKSYELVTTGIRALRAGWESISAYVGRMYTLTTKYLQDMVGPAFAVIADKFKALQQAISKGVETFYSSWKEGTEALGRVVRGGLETARTAVVKTFETATKTISEGLEATRRVIVNSFEAARTTVVDSFKSAFKFLSEIAKKILDFFRMLPEMFLNLVRNMAQAIADFPVKIWFEGLGKIKVKVGRVIGEIKLWLEFIPPRVHMLATVDSYQIHVACPFLLFGYMVELNEKVKEVMMNLINILTPALVTIITGEVVGRLASYIAIKMPLPFPFDILAGIGVLAGANVVLFWSLFDRLWASKEQVMSALFGEIISLLIGLYKAVESLGKAIVGAIQIILVSLLNTIETLQKLAVALRADIIKFFLEIVCIIKDMISIVTSLGRIIELHC